jgi:hypothetical protein
MVSHPAKCFKNCANHYTASNQASSTQEGHPE